jgi:polyisoprenoid-binding protein YceI
MARYLLDPSQSRFTVQALARGMLSSLGHNPTFAVRVFTGEANFNPAAPADSSIRFTIEANSLSLTDRVSAKDQEEIESRMRQEVLETARFPEILFEGRASTTDMIAENWYRVGIRGTLSLHGLSNPIEVDVQLRLMGDQLRLSGECKLSQSEYRIRRVSALAGMIVLQDELKVAFDLCGLKQNE